MVYVLYDRVVRKAYSNYCNHVGVVIETHIRSKVCTSYLLSRVQAAGVCVVCVVYVCVPHVVHINAHAQSPTHVPMHNAHTQAHTCANTHAPASCNWCGFVHSHSWEGGDVCLLQKWDTFVEVISNGLCDTDKTRQTITKTETADALWTQFEVAHHILCGHHLYAHFKRWGRCQRVLHMVTLCLVHRYMSAVVTHTCPHAQCTHTHARALML